MELEYIASTELLTYAIFHGLWLGVFAAFIRPLYHWVGRLIAK